MNATKVILKLTKPCGKVDKYEAIDAAGEIIKNDPPVGPTYLAKSVVNGATKISLTIAVEK